jgi:hypothetical protein
VLASTTEDPGETKAPPIDVSNVGLLPIVTVEVALEVAAAKTK